MVSEKATLHPKVRNFHFQIQFDTKLLMLGKSAATILCKSQQISFVYTVPNVQFTENQ